MLKEYMNKFAKKINDILSDDEEKRDKQLTALQIAAVGGVAIGAFSMAAGVGLDHLFNDAVPGKACLSFAARNGRVILKHTGVNAFGKVVDMQKNLIFGCSPERALELSEQLKRMAEAAKNNVDLVEF